MLDASEKWKRNKWWIADRVVESPHLTSFYVRKTDGLDKDESWQDTAQYWCVISTLNLYVINILVGTTVEQSTLLLHFPLRWKKLVKLWNELLIKK